MRFRARKRVEVRFKEGKRIRIRTTFVRVCNEFGLAVPVHVCELQRFRLERVDEARAVG